MRFLIATDKFKGSMSSIEICNIFKTELSKIFNDSTIICIPMADGGEGSLECYTYLSKAKIITKEYIGPNFNKISASFAVNGNDAFIELAQTSGLMLASKKNPTETTTYGVGEQIKDAINMGCKNIYIAIGGSATNDAGCGMAAALGVKFYDEGNKTFIPVGGTLHKIKKIDYVNNFSDINFTILSDVKNVLYGKNGASYVYAKQKGANNDEIKLLDENLKHFNKIVTQDKPDYHLKKGSGAAGGFGAGAMYFLNATLVSGAKVFANLTDLKRLIKTSDIIISGEGKVDLQTKNGKLIDVISKLTKNKKLVVFCGKNETISSDFDIVEINKKNEPLNESINNSKQNLINAIHNYFKKSTCN